MFRKILIANRGEIALRIHHTAQKLGIQTVAIYSNVDRQARHTLTCDEAYNLGGNTPKESYLAIDKIIAIAKLSGAQAIHPGYGFLSENAEFAEACAKENLVFIGPPASALRAMGLKSQAKTLLQQAGIPLLPGYHGSEQNPQFLFEQAEKIGFPVMIKASAGGGGRGMRIVRLADEFFTMLDACQREAQNSFANSHVLLEKYIAAPRHIEIQILADNEGHVISLLERDCSVQRRHQKVIEEAPAPGMTPAVRQAMGATALTVARSVGYTGAGTVEFIVETDENQQFQFYFMEMNTRLQVEHPVTEAITGLDLVEWQLKIANNEKLSLKQDDITPQGHAIEVRLCAENPQIGFLPATGKLQVFCYNPSWAHFTVAPVRLDCGFQAGDQITSYYDSLLGKLIVHAPNRELAIQKLRLAIEQIHIVGLQNNLEFLNQLLQTESFLNAKLDTKLIEREAQFLAQAREIPIELALSAALAQHFQPTSSEEHNPWEFTDAWEILGFNYRDIVLQLENQATYQIQVRNLKDDSYHIRYKPWVDLTHQNHSSPATDWQNFTSRWQQLSEHTWLIQWAAQQFQVALYSYKNILHLFCPIGSAKISRVDPLSLYQKNADHTPAKTKITSPMPGKILRIFVKVGDQVVAKQALALLEAMKMEHALLAPFAGTVQALRYQEGTQVDEGVEIVQLAPNAE